MTERFIKTYSQGCIDVIEIWVDTVTGVNYVFHRNGNAAGFTPLLDKDGREIIGRAIDTSTAQANVKAIFNALNQIYI